MQLRGRPNYSRARAYGVKFLSTKGTRKPQERPTWGPEMLWPPTIKNGGLARRQAHLKRGMTAKRPMRGREKVFMLLEG